MTIEDFTKKRFRHSELILFTSDDGIDNECLLLAIDFEQALKANSID